MNVLVISGFLGAGKTTFIKHLVKKTGKTFCVFENEYAGSITDETELKSDDVRVWEMTEGCICCTMKNSFSNKLMNILAMLNPEYLIVESTGAGYLSRIIRNIQSVEHQNLHLLQAVTVVDAASCTDARFLSNPLFEDQIRNAQTIVLSKCETLNQSERTAAGKKISAINPNAHIITEHYAEKPKSFWDSLLLTQYNGQPAEADAPEEVFENLTLDNVCPRSFASLLALLQDMLGGRYGQVVRAKGFLKAEGHWIKCNLSGDRYSLTWIDSAPRSNFVCIGHFLDRRGIENCFTQEIIRMKHQETSLVRQLICG